MNHRPCGAQATPPRPPPPALDGQAQETPKPARISAAVAVVGVDAGSQPLLGGDACEEAGEVRALLRVEDGETGPLRLVDVVRAGLTVAGAVNRRR
ncbi:hypothetical protein ACFY15_35580 [Streptomyces sp. NPDC001373]|uniref:hypothetical protein n=1 Tax=Streptomyces sp. NPDC001373 TaxID=3364565 RepID=UPI0036BB945C